jgi:hypothetical protein
MAMRHIIITSSLCIAACISTAHICEKQYHISCPSYAQAITQEREKARKAIIHHKEYEGVRSVCHVPVPLKYKHDKEGGALYITMKDNNKKK